MPSEDLPPETVVGDSATDRRVGGVIVIKADCVEAPTRVVTVATFWIATDEVVAVKVALVCPAAIETFAGTLTVVTLLVI